MREAIAISKRGTRRPNNQMTTPTQVLCTGVSPLSLVVEKIPSFLLPN